MKHARGRYGAPLSLHSEVRDVMTPGVVSVPSDASLARAQEALVAHDVHALLVTDRATGEPLGFITPRGLLAWVTSDANAHSARQAVTEDVHSVDPSASVTAAIELMIAADVSHLVVARRPGAAPEGVIADIDIVRLHART